jgi:hypothetical protein
MTTIVKHRRTGNKYILLGINGEANKVNPSRFISELFNQEKAEVSCSATVCDVQGNIFLAYIDDLIVVEIDGVKPAEVLPAATYEASNTPFDDASRSRNPKGFAPGGAAVEVVQSPASEFAEDDFEDDFESEEDDFEDESNTTEDTPDISVPPAKTFVVESLDAPSSDQSNDDEDWI